MGCSASAIGGSSMSKKYDRRPKISVRIQSEARKLENHPLVIFVFGGPGSHKGRIIDDLMTSYKFKFLSVENIILEDFADYVGVTEPIETAKDMKNVVNDHSSSLNLSWILNTVAARIESDEENKQYVIDIMPSLRYFFKVPGLIRDCSSPLKEFEKKFPVSLALNLSIPADKISKATPTRSADSAKSPALSKDGQNDEADASRTLKRALLWADSAKTYLDYFSRTERLVTVDVSCGVSDNIWSRVHEVLCEMDFIPERTVNTVILFTFNMEQANYVDTEKYLMESMNLNAIASNPYGPMCDILRDLSRHVDTYSKDFDSFVVHCDDTSLCNKDFNSDGRSKLILLDIGEGYIEDYLPGSPKNYTPIATNKRYRAISSIENEICLFPVGTNNDLCCQIAELMARQRNS